MGCSSSTRPLYKATPEQLCRLHYSPASIKYVKANLKELVDAGYVQAGRYIVEYEHLTHYPFRARYYYMLAPPSVKYMAGLGFDVSETWKPSANTHKHGLFVPHTLEINDVIIAGALLKGVEPRFQLERFIHESTYKARPIQVNTVNLMADACLIFHQAGTSVRTGRKPRAPRARRYRSHTTVIYNYGTLNF